MANNNFRFRGKRGNKLNATKVELTIFDGTIHRFDSKAEARRYKELEALMRDGKILGLQLQKKYELVPKGRYDDGVCARSVCYNADFVYWKVEKIPGEHTRFNAHLKPDFVPVKRYKEFGYPTDAILPGEVGACGKTHYGDINGKWSAWQLKWIVEDVKGYRNPGASTYAVFTLKKKLMLYRHNITVREVVMK